METVMALAIGFLLDLCFGDPHWLPHPVQAFGGLITLLEKGLRALCAKTRRGQLLAGAVLVLLLCAVGFAVPALLLWAAGLVHPWLRIALESVMCYQILATKSLRDAAVGIGKRLQAGDVAGARRAVAMVVGRDTETLDGAGIARAAVETVAENTSDGVVAPMVFMAVGGAPLGFLYKAINTMDSMVGYKNERYLYFGRAAALVDDVANWLPARLCALLMVAAAALCGQSPGAALRIWRRDRRNHLSPNSAQPEAAAAGALGIQLGGDNHYGGRLVQKPTIGDATRAVETADIFRICRLLFVTAALCLLLCCGARAGVVALLAALAPVAAQL